MLTRSVAGIVASLLMVTGALSQDGARAYHLLPQGTDILSLTTTLMNLGQTYPDGFVESSETDIFVVSPAYRTSVDVFGNAGTFLIGMSLGKVSSSASTMIGNIETETDFVAGDSFVGGTVGLIGSPSLSPLDYSQYKPGFRASVAAKLFLPTGAYDSGTPLNFGQNRWSLQASLPLSYVLGETMIDPELATFEITPSVKIFGDNDDPYDADVTSQEALFGLEGHATRNFNSSVWGSLDAYYLSGGETSTDGVGNDDAKDELSLGATLGLSFGPSFSLRLSYDQVVYTSVPDAVAHRLEVTSAYLF